VGPGQGSCWDHHGTFLQDGAVPPLPSPPPSPAQAYPDEREEGEEEEEAREDGKGGYWEEEGGGRWLKSEVSSSTCTLTLYTVLC